MIHRLHTCLKGACALQDAARALVRMRTYRRHAPKEHLVCATPIKRIVGRFLLSKQLQELVHLSRRLWDRRQNAPKVAGGCWGGMEGLTGNGENYEKAGEPYVCSILYSHAAA